MSRILLINPSYRSSYGGAKASIVNPVTPTLGLAAIAATARQRGHQVEILDLCWRDYDIELIRERVNKSEPDIVGITATTPLMNQLRDISVLVKDISQEIVIVGGGAHPSSLPMETLAESRLDAVCVGEADLSFADICDGRRFSEIRGLWYRSGDTFESTLPRTPIENLDDLPFPAWDLFDPNDYRHMSRLLCRRPPVTIAEFSRGCVFKCDFCASKMTMALGYRKKSPERCAEEVAYMYALGFREFMLADDIFTSDQDWAVSVCEAIQRKGVDMAWSCTNGIRVESANDELFSAMRRAGCYRVSFGFESGSDEVLKRFGKGGKASIEQGKAAVQMARKAGIDTNGFFLLGLSPDTEATMQETIAYARELPLDMMKFGIAIGFPGTPMFNEYVRLGLVKSFNWDDYFIYTEKPLFAHPNLDYQTVQKYMTIAYKVAMVLNPKFIWRRLKRGVKTGEFLWDAYYALKFLFMPAVGKSETTAYYARDRWPRYDFSRHPPTAGRFAVVRKNRQATANVDKVDHH